MMILAKKCFRFLFSPFRRSIRNKLIVTMILLCSIPLIFVTLLAAENTRKSVETEVIESNLTRIDWTAGYLEDRLNQLNNIIYSMLINESFNENMRKTDDSNFAIAFNAQKGVTNTVLSIFYSNVKDLNGIQVFLKDANKYFTIDNLKGVEVTTPNHIPFQIEPIFAQNIDFTIQNAGSGQSFYLARSINRFEDHARLGGISLEIKWTVMENALNLLNPGQEHAVLVANEQGEILYQPASKMTPFFSHAEILRMTDPGPGYIRTKDYYVFYNTIHPGNLRLFKIIPTSFIDHSAQKTLQYGIVIGVISILFSILIAVFVAWKTSKPIVHLARSMQGMIPIKDSEVPVISRKDEIGLLESRFYNMSYRLKEYIKTEYSMNLEKRTAQLKALQSQVNPHFLQNTLQLIGSMAFSKSPGEIYDVIRSLSEMFRYVIRDPVELTTIQHEMAHLNNYMFIQKQRFTSRISSKISIEPGMENGLIPKLTLQPIVENAFIHGLDKKTGAWEIHITVNRSLIGIEITIEDNGLGMDELVLQRVRMGLAQTSEQIWTNGESIGLNNVAARLYMHFGEPYGITVNSQPGRGTMIKLHLPLNGREQS
ncbi:histidine kinase [Paenibacillus sp. GCM10027628]|uniref:sensor histidine kinase n=1 Tax=Paenibacillus sp. GCM10027628 TaxID=3273413 RepID=UPI003641C6CD